jgi:tetratricopeptide (TPR) repeat protein
MRVLMAAAMMVAAMALPAGARAQQSDERRQCFATDGMSPEQKLRGCTAVIESGGATPQNLVAAFINRGNAYQSNRDYGRAIEDYDQAIRINPIAPLAFNNRGNVYLSKQDYDRALEDYDQAIRIDPKYAVAFNNRGLAKQRKGQNDLAAEDYEQAIRIDPKYALAFVNRAAIHRIKARFDLAIQDCDQAIALSPNLAAAFYGRALAYQERAQWDFDAYLNEGRYEDLAIKDFDEAIRLNADNAPPFAIAAASTRKCGSTSAPLRISTRRSGWIPMPPLRSMAGPTRSGSSENTTAPSPTITRPSH